MALLIITICSSVLALFGMCVYGKYIVLSLLSKDSVEWWQYPVWAIGLLPLCAIWACLYFSPDFGDRNGAAAPLWTFSLIFVLGYAAVMIMGYFHEWRADFRKMRIKIEEINKMNEVRNWTDVKTNALRHIATYWYWLLIVSPLALGAIVLAWLGITAIGIQVLKYAHAELGAVIIFKDGNISLAGFPLSLLLSGTLGCVGGVLSFKILQWRSRAK